MAALCQSSWQIDRRHCQFTVQVDEVCCFLGADSRCGALPLNSWAKAVPSMAYPEGLGIRKFLSVTRVRMTAARGAGGRTRLPPLQMMSKHRDLETVMRYEHGREKLDQNAVNFLGYDEE